MSEVKVICISDIERSHRGSSLGEDLSVFHGNGVDDVFGGENGAAFYFRAFSYLLVLRGAASVKLDQRIYEVTPRTIISQSPMHLAQYCAVSPDFEFKVMAVTLKMIDGLKMVNIRPRIVEGVRTHLRPVSELTESEAHIVESCFDDLAECVERVGHRYRLELVENSMCRFFLEYDNIFSVKDDEGDVAQLNPRRQSIVDKFIELVTDGMLEHADVSYYCGKMGITPQYLNKVMTSQTGMRPSDFISEMLYAEARNMLATGRVTVQEVASRLGFADQSSFGKFFKRCSGVSPSHFAKSNVAYPMSELHHH